MPTKKMISWTPPSVKRPIYAEQAMFFAFLIKELIGAWREARNVRFCDLPEYRRFVQGAYACGFVCRDIDGLAFSDQMGKLTDCPDELRRADFTTSRMYVHTMMRAERHCDAGGDEGGGCVIAAVRSGALSIIADRLENELDWRDS